MIPFFDHFVDTREKRYHLMIGILLLLALIVVVPYLFLGYELMQLNSYESLFDLVKKPLIDGTYISRIIVDAISITKLSFANVVSCLLQNLSALEILMLGVLLLCVGVLEKKRSTFICLLLLVVEVFALCGFALVALGSSSLQGVISNIRYMGILILFINMLLMVLLLFHMVKQIKHYKNALSYDTEEIKEHMESSQ